MQFCDILQDYSVDAWFEASASFFRGVGADEKPKIYVKTYSHTFEHVEDLDTLIGNSDGQTSDFESEFAIVETLRKYYDSYDEDKLYKLSVHPMDIAGWYCSDDLHFLDRDNREFTVRLFVRIRQFA